MTDETFLKLKEEYLESILEATKQSGGLPTHFTLFATQKKETDQKVAVINLTIPTEFFDSDEGKETVVDKIIPLIANKVNREFEVHAIAWVSEAWLREASKDDKIQDYRSLPIKKEVLIISIESEKASESFLYNVARNGHIVNEEGNLIDNIELTKLDVVPDSTTGRFTGLLKHFTKK